MKLKFTFLLLSSFLIFQSVSAQTAGDFRSSGANGLWTTPSNWERFDGINWVAATVAPSSTDGIITIRGGDTILLNSPLTIDQVRVEALGAFNIFQNPGSNFSVTLNDVAGEEDIQVFGELLLSINATLTGTGSVYINAGGMMKHRNTGTLDANTTIAAGGNMELDGIMNLNSTLVNNGVITWNIDGPYNFTDATLENNGLIVTSASITVNLLIQNTAGTNVLRNNATGVIRRDGAVGFLAINVPFENAGTLQGVGDFVLNNIVSNTGSINPGNTIGILTINDRALENPSAATINIRIESSTTPGTGHDQLEVTGTTYFSNLTLNVTENPTAPLGIYTIMTKPSAQFNNSITSVNIPSNYSLIYNASGDGAVRVQKNSFVLPLTWGSFTAVAKNDKVALNWSTLQETNTASFIVEHSTNGQNFTPVATITAAGNTSVTSRYNTTHQSPNLNAINYYRVKQIDIDGRSTYSITVPVRFKNSSVVLVQALPNPVVNTLQLSVQGKNVTVVLTNANGAAVRNLKLAEGQHPVNVSDLPAGVYYLGIYQNEKFVETQRIVKR